VYQTIAKLKRAGKFDVAFFLDAPRLVRCVGLSVEADPALELKAKGQVIVEPLIENRLLRVGGRVRLRFLLMDPGTRAPKMALDDVQVLTFLVPGDLRETKLAAATKGGIYEIDFVPQQAGVYHVAVSCRSLRVTFDTFPPLILEVKDK